MITIQLAVKPVSWLAPHHKNNIFFNPRHTEKQTAKLLIKCQYHGAPLNSNVKLDFTFFSQPPKSASKKQKQKMLDGEIIPTKMDVTNCVKFYEDCLKGIVIEDDRIVAQIIARKLYGNEDKVIIGITPYAYPD